MDTHRIGQNRIRTRRTYCIWLLVGALATLVGLADSASASLILNTLRYDGHVRDGGDTGVEKHFADYGPAGLSAPSSFQPLPAVDPDPDPPLDPSLDLQINSYLRKTGGLGTTPFVEIWINTQSGPIFANPLDGMLAAPIELEVELYKEDLGDMEKLIFPHIGAELFSPLTLPPHPAPASVSISNNRGSENDPITVTIGLTANQARISGVTGQAKVSLYFDTMQVPEPASLALLGLGCVGVLGLARRRRFVS